MIEHIDLWSFYFCDFTLCSDILFDIWIVGLFLQYGSPILYVIFRIIVKTERQLRRSPLKMAGQDAQPAASSAASSRDAPAASSDQAASSGQWPQLPKPTAKSQVRGRDATPQAATTRQRSKGGANKSGDAPEPLSWGEIFKAPDTYLRPLRAACQDDGISVPLASAARNSGDGCGAIRADPTAATSSR